VNEKHPRDLVIYDVVHDQDFGLFLYHLGPGICYHVFLGTSCGVEEMENEILMAMDGGGEVVYET
jgi:hypothetical protein